MYYCSHNEETFDICAYCFASALYIHVGLAAMYCFWPHCIHAIS